LTIFDLNMGISLVKVLQELEKSPDLFPGLCSWNCWQLHLTCLRWPRPNDLGIMGIHDVCMCIYIYIRNYIYTLYNIIYIYTTGNIYIYIGEVWRVQVGLSWLRSWCSTWFCEPGKLTNKLSWGYCMYTSHDVQWKTQPKESQQNIAKQCCLMMSSWQTKILLAASC
jgi:hypothetical protein